MGFNVVIDVIEKARVEVSDEIAQTVAEVHEALKGLPGDRAANLDFDTTEEAKSFMTAAKQWADDNGKRFTRVGDIKGKPNRVSFRVVTKRAENTAPGTSPEPGAAADAAGTAEVTPAAE